MTVKIPFARNDWVFHTGPWFWPHVQRRIKIPGLSDFGIFKNGASSILTWVWADTTPAACRHFWRRWTLLCGYCIRAWIIFHKVTSEYDPAFVLLILRLQLQILKMTEIHQWRKMNFSALVPCFVNHFFLVSDLRQLPCRNVLQFFPILSPLLPLYREFLNAWGIGMNLWTRLLTSHRIHPFCSDVILTRFVSSSFWPWSRAFVGINNTSVFCLAFPIIAVAFLHCSSS